MFGFTTTHVCSDEQVLRSTVAMYLSQKSIKQHNQEDCAAIAAAATSPTGRRLLWRTLHELLANSSDNMSRDKAWALQQAILKYLKIQHLSNQGFFDLLNNELQTVCCTPRDASFHNIQVTGEALINIVSVLNLIVLGNASISGNLSVGQDVSIGQDLSVGGTICASNGTALAPAYTFCATPQTGIFSSGTNDVQFSTNGTSRMNIDANGSTTIAVPTSGTNPALTVNGSTNAPALQTIAGAGQNAFSASSGSNTATAYGFTSSPGSGMYLFGGNSLQFAANNLNTMSITSTGMVYIHGALVGTIACRIDGSGGPALRVIQNPGANIIETSDADAAHTAYGFISSTGTGMYCPASQSLGFATNGAARITVDSGGSANIAAPTAGGNPALTVNGSTSAVALDVIAGSGQDGIHSSGNIVLSSGQSLTLTGGAGATALLTASALAGSPYTLTMPVSNGTTNQVLTLADNAGTLTWTTPAGGTVTAVTASSPLASSGGTTPNITIQTASAAQAGALSAANWTTFNNKVSNGGNSYGAAMSVGTNDTNTMSLRSNNTDRLTIATTGAVGVNAPANGSLALDVTGPVSGEGAARITAGSGKFALAVGGTGDNGTAANPLITFSGDGHTGLYAPALNEMSISASSSERLRITSEAAVCFSNYLLSAYRDTPFKIVGDGTRQPVDFPNIYFDLSGSFSSSTTYRAPVTGYYFLTATVGVQSDNVLDGSVTVTNITAGLDYSFAYFNLKTTEVYESVTITALAHLTQGDVVQVVTVPPLGTTYQVLGNIFISLAYL